jgi:hypothetical protein
MPNSDLPVYGHREGLSLGVWIGEWLSCLSGTKSANGCSNSSDDHLKVANRGGFPGSSAAAIKQIVRALWKITPRCI